jgi:hypothetical protein
MRYFRLPYFLCELRRKIYQLRNENEDEKERDVIGQYRLYSATNGSKPISPIPISIPMMQMLNFVTLNDIHFLLVWQLLLLFSAFSFRN